MLNYLGCGHQTSLVQRSCESEKTDKSEIPSLVTPYISLKTIGEIPLEFFFKALREYLESYCVHKVKNAIFSDLKALCDLENIA